VKEADPQLPAKLKLQLFPINEATRKALEKVKLSPMDHIFRGSDIFDMIAITSYYWLKTQVFMFE
jgi:hypothetical protein